MSTEHIFRIRKVSDSELVEKCRQISEQCGFDRIGIAVPLLNYNASDSRDPNWGTEKSLTKVQEMGATLITKIDLWVGPNVLMTVTRDQTNPLLDSVSISVANPGRGVDTDLVLKTVQVSRRTFEPAATPAWNLKTLGVEIDEHYKARELAIAKQEQRMFEFFSRMTEFTERQTRDHQQKMMQLEADFADRQRKLDEQHQQRMTALNERDAEFEKKKAEFDLQEARGMRRKLREDQKEELKELIKKFALTPETQAKRRPVWFAAVLTIAALASVSAYLLFGQPPFDAQGNLNYYLFARQIAFTLGAAGFVWFFIHWSNRWFQRHADEELRLKRLSLDLDRASWVFEMILDWQKETKQEFPPELLKQLAKNLYTADGVGTDDMTKADLLASLFGAAANMKLKVGGAELDFDRKSLTKVEQGT